MTAAVLAEIIGPDLLIVLLVVALLFGGNQLPKLARSLGSAKSEFEKGLRESPEETGALAPEPPPAAPAPRRDQVDEADTVTITRAELDELIAARDGSKHSPRSSAPEQQA